MQQTSLLPPQFLLPSWSTRQLAGLLARCHSPQEQRRGYPTAPYTRQPQKGSLRKTTAASSSWRGVAREKAMEIHRARIATGPGEGEATASQARMTPAPSSEGRPTSDRIVSEVRATESQRPPGTWGRRRPQDSWHSIPQHGEAVARGPQVGEGESGFESKEVAHERNDADDAARTEAETVQKQRAQMEETLREVKEEMHKQLEAQRIEFEARMQQISPSKYSPAQGSPASVSKLEADQQSFKGSKSFIFQSQPEKARPTAKAKNKGTPMSLFDELFPDDDDHSRFRDRMKEKRLETLPAFGWDARDLDIGTRAEKLRETRADARKVVPSRSQPPQDPPIQLQRVVGMKEETPRNVRLQNATVMILNACSKTLEESDFFRLGPKGEHIEGWTSGLLKVIPGRDRITLEPLDYFVLLFADDASARAYLDQTMRLHKLSRAKGSNAELDIPLPKGYLEEGENLTSLLRGFSLAPGYGKLSLGYVSRPHTKGVLRLLSDGGQAAKISRATKAEHMVLFTTDVGRLAHMDIAEALSDDGRKRNLHWKFGKQRNEAIQEVDADGELVAAMSAPSRIAASHDPRQRGSYKGPGRFIISFKDSNEARRFVREWHMRPFQVNRAHNPGDEAPPIVKAQVVW